jgi:hypothetical protein
MTYRRVIQYLFMCIYTFIRYLNIYRCNDTYIGIHKTHVRVNLFYLSFSKTGGGGASSSGRSITRSKTGRGGNSL